MPFMKGAPRSKPSGPASPLKALGAGLLGPLRKRNIVELLQALTAVAEAAGQEGRVEAKACLREVPESKGALDSVVRPLTSTLMPTMTRALTQHFCAIARRRMAATALAIRLYEIEHARRCEKLTNLVPEYLPAVPIDPFSPDRRPIGYIPNAPYPRLYSVGRNGIDEGGKDAEKPGGFADWDKFDIPFYLSPARPPRSEDGELEVKPPSPEG